jgi:hypothetical protein
MMVGVNRFVRVYLVLKEKDVDLVVILWIWNF